MHTLPQTSPTDNALSEALNTRLGRLGVSVAAAGLVALAAHISLPLPFTPVPLTLQPFAVVVVGMLLGPVNAFSAMLLYLVEGAVGLPVFSPQGPGGAAQLLGPTAGYLFSYPIAAAAGGWLARHLRIGSVFTCGLVAATLSTAIILLAGAVWLSSLFHLHAIAAWQLAVSPFLFGELVKIFAAATLFRAFRRA